MQPLVARDQLVGESQTGHQAALLEPEDGRKRAAEEDALNRGEGDEARREGRVLVLDPSNGPVGLLADAGDWIMLIRYEGFKARRRLTGVDGIEEVGTLLLLLDVGVDQQRVGLRVNVLHHDLEAVEATGLRDLHLAREALNKVLVDDAIGGGEEGKDVGDEVALVVVEAGVPIVHVLGQIDLFGSPEGRFGLLVHLPDLDRCEGRSREGLRSGIPHGT